jgi:hypothetical protein
MFHAPALQLLHIRGCKSACHEKMKKKTTIQFLTLRKKLSLLQK